MSDAIEVLCSGIIVADHLCAPIPRMPAAGELVTTERMLLTIGGCAANVAVDLRKMGVSTAVAGRIGDDVFGRIVNDMLREHGVGVDRIRTSPGRDTSQTLIVNVTGEDRRFIHTFGANADFCAADIPSEFLSQAKVVYLGGYLVMPGLRPNALAEVFATARSRGARTVLDVVVPGPGEYLSQLEPLLPHVDVFMPNHNEAELITGSSDVWRQCDQFMSLGVRTVVITMGGTGAVLANRLTKLQAGVYDVPCLDASGGGDAFAAGFIFGLLNEMDHVNCLKIASALGASCVQTMGTTPGVFTRPECEKFMQSHPIRIKSV